MNPSDPDQPDNRNPPPANEVELPAQSRSHGAPAVEVGAASVCVVPQPAGVVEQQRNPDGVVPASGASTAVGAMAGQRVESAGGEIGPAPRRRRNRRRGRRNSAERAAAAGATGAAGPIHAHAGDTSEVDEGADSDDEDAPEQHPTADLPSDSGEVFAQVISGDFDANTEADAAAQVEPERRVLAPDADAPKLHKVLAQAGIGSRRDMEELIEQGRITVNAQVAHTGQRILRGDQIRIDGKPVRVQIAPPPTRVLAYHKPAGEVVTHDDPQNRPTVFRKLPRLGQGKWQSVGRLDINTEGLLLFTNSGELANQLMHPRFGVEREYAVRVLGTLVDEQREMLLEGVDIDGQMASFRSIEDGGGEGVNRWYRVVITEGRNREVRKLFEAVDMAVSRLIRIRYGCVVLPRGLKRGVWVDLADEDVRALRRLTGLSEQRQSQRGTREGGKQGRNSRRGSRDQGGVYGNGETGRGERSQREPGEGGAIPNPLQQTYDKRAIREARQPRRDISEDGPIPNPLEQTYDKRFVQKPRGPGGGKRGGSGENQKQPDPMQTSVGYIGADAFHRKIAGGGGGRGGRGNRGRGR